MKGTRITIVTTFRKAMPNEVFGAIEHQICRFHILAELNRAVLHAVASVRKHLAAQEPKRDSVY